jgi:catalase
MLDHAPMVFVTYPKPLPASYATLPYYNISTFKLADANGAETFIRYHGVPEARVHTPDAGTNQGENYMQEELSTRLERGPIVLKSPPRLQIRMMLRMMQQFNGQSRERRWNWEPREVDNLVSDNLKEKKDIIFDPIPRVDGVERSNDPLLKIRAAVYLLSGRERRVA